MEPQIILWPCVTLDMVYISPPPDNQDSLSLASLVGLDDKAIRYNTSKRKITQLLYWSNSMIRLSKRNPPTREKVFGLELAICEWDRLSWILGLDILQIASIHPEYSMWEELEHGVDYMEKRKKGKKKSSGEDFERVLLWI